MVAIYRAILKAKTPVDTYNVGIACGNAELILSAVKKKIAADYSLFESRTSGLMNANTAKRFRLVDEVEGSEYTAPDTLTSSPRAYYRRGQQLLNSRLNEQPRGYNAASVMASLAKTHRQK